MRTPKEYTENLKNHIVSDDMLEAALFSVNKRAKNWRDKKREYGRCWYDKYNYREKAENEEEKMYAKKDKLLSLLTPICIHKEFAGNEMSTVYDYQDEYDEILLKEIIKGSVIHMGYYQERDEYDSDEMDYWDWDDDYYCEGRTVHFFEYEDRSKPKYRYYLYYVIGTHSFHTPIKEQDVDQYDLPIFVIDTLTTTGHECTDLISVQFVDKLISLIDNFDFQRTGKTMEPEYISELLDKERETAKLKCMPDEQEEKNTKRTTMVCYWQCLTRIIKNDLTSTYNIPEVEVRLTADEKADIEKRVKEQISGFLKHSNFYSKIRSSKKKIVNRIKHELRNQHYDSETSTEFVIPLSFASKFMEAFAMDTDVSIRKVSKFLMVLSY